METSKVIAAQNLDGYCFRDVPAIADGYTLQIIVKVLFLCQRKHTDLHLKGYVGGWDFDSYYIDFVLNKNADNEVHMLIDSLGGSLATALPIVA